MKPERFGNRFSCAGLIGTVIERLWNGNEIKISYNFWLELINQSRLLRKSRFCYVQVRIRKSVADSVLSCFLDPRINIKFYKNFYINILSKIRTEKFE